MSVPFEQKERYSVQDLLQILSCLRAPGGCPWDREQTHQSIRSDFLEETYEAIDAINKQDDAALQEELGDVLLQVAFHAQIAAEQGVFTFDDVADGICKKLIVRHPHVFGSVQADSTQQVLQNWDAIKRSKGNATQADLLRSVPHAMPALSRAAKVQNRARRVGIEQDAEMAQADLLAAWEGFCNASDQQREAAYGALLFALSCSAHRKGLDPELCLMKATDAFIERFDRAEAQMLAEGVDWNTAEPKHREALRDKVFHP